MSVFVFLPPRCRVTRAYNNMMMIKKDSREKVVKSVFNSLKEATEKRKKLIWGIMLRVNIFFMLFEKLLYVTKELLLMLLIFSSAFATIKLLSFSLPLAWYLGVAKINLFNGSTYENVYWNMLRHGNVYIVPNEVLFMLQGIKMRSNDDGFKNEKLSCEGHSFKKLIIT